MIVPGDFLAAVQTTFGRITFHAAKFGLEINTLKTKSIFSIPDDHYNSKQVKSVFIQITGNGPATERADEGRSYYQDRQRAQKISAASMGAVGT